MVATPHSTPLLPPASLSRRERRKAEVRGRIVEAAVDLFGEVGFANTKVSEICERADVAHKTFFNYFPTKRDVLREIASGSIDELLEDIATTCRQHVSSRERIRHFFERVADYATDAGPMHRELLTEVIHVAHETNNQGEQAQRLHEAFSAIVREGCKAGDLRSDHSVQTQTEMILGAYYALMFNWAHLESYPLRRQALAAARFLTDALCNPPEVHE